MTNMDNSIGANDKSTIGVTDAGQEILSQLTAHGDLFARDNAAFKAAVALALNLGLSPTTASAKFNTKWGVGGGFADLIDFVSWYCDTDMPARLVERLGDAGLMHIAPRLDMHEDIRTIFGIQEANI